MPAYFFAAMFKKSKIGTAPANAPTVDVIDVSSNTLVVTGGTPGTLSNMTGVYTYTYTGVSGNYIAMFKTADSTVDAQHVPSYTPQVIADNLDAAVSTRLASSAYSAPPTAAAISDAVWDEAAAGHVTAGSVGKTLADLPSTSAIVVAFLDALLSGHTIPGSVAAALAAAGSASDPMTNPASGYASGTLGKIIAELANYPVIVHRDTVDNYGNVYVTQSCDYYAEDGRALTWTKPTWPVLTGATVVMRVNTLTGVVVLPCVVTSAQAVQLELSATQVDSLGLGVIGFDLLAELANGHDVDLYLQQMLTVTSKLAAA